MKWVIAYDVSKDRSRRKIARRLKQMGFRRQKSVFEGEAAPGNISLLLDELTEFLDCEQDVLTAWPSTENGPARIEHRGHPRANVQREWLIF